MTKQSLIVLGIVVALGASAFAATKPAPPKGTATIALPADGTAFKPGPGSNLAQGACLSCHSSAYVSTQPVLTKAQWTAEVVKMKNVYGAPIADAQIPPIVDYLTAQYGKP